MMKRSVTLLHSEGTGYVIPLGPVNLVTVVAKMGLVGCGAFDVIALEKFDYPAARVKPTRGSAIKTIEDLLSGEIREVNSPAKKYGIENGMNGKEALDLLS